MSHLVVLTSVGLLYFSDVKKPPVDLFPVINSEVSIGDPSQYEQSTTIIELKRNVNKRIVLRAFTISQFDDWFKAIKDLQTQTLTKTLESQLSYKSNDLDKEE